MIFLFLKSCFYTWILFLVICLEPSIVFAGAVLQRQMMQQKQIEEQIVQQQYQQMIAQKQAQEMVRYQQAIAQKQAYEQALYQQAYQQAAYQKAIQEYQIYKQQMQQIVVQRQAEMQLAKQVQTAIAQKQAMEMAQYQQARLYKQAMEQAQYKKVVDTIQQKQALEVQQQAIARQQKALINEQVNEYVAFLAKRRELALQEAAMAQQVQVAKAGVEAQVYGQAMTQHIADQAHQEALEQAWQQQAYQKAQQEAYQQSLIEKQNLQKSRLPQYVQETEIEIGDLWQELDRSSLIWEQIMDREIKVLTVAEYIDRFEKSGIHIKKSPGFYVQMIEEMIQQSHEMLQIPFSHVLTYMAIMEYDFDNGENKDELAKRTLGEESFLSNRQRVFGR